MSYSRWSHISFALETHEHGSVHVFHKGTKPFLSGKRQSVFSPLFAWHRFWCLGTNSVTDMPSNVITSLDTELTT